MFQTFFLQIPHGGKHIKEYILRTLLANIAPVVFTPLSVNSVLFS